MSARYFAAALAALVSLTALHGCSDDEPEPASGVKSADVPAGTTPEETASPEVPTPASDPDLPFHGDVRAFVEAITSNNTASIDNAFDLTIEGSLAHAYAIYLAIVSGSEFGTQEQAAVTSIDGGFKACYPSAPDDCDEFTNFDGFDGLIVDLAVNGEPLRGNILIGHDKPQRAGGLGTIELVAARVTTDGNLFVVLKVRSAAHRIQTASASSLHRNSDGRQIEANGSLFGPSELGPRSSGTVLISYPGSELGGTLTFPLYADDLSVEQAVTIQLK